MANWRRKQQGGEFYEQEAYRIRSNYRKPSQSQESWKASVPWWEKKFCSVVGGVPWQRFVENKRYVHLCKDVLDWDDSAGEEAFRNAKRRFWAEIHHVPSDAPSPPNPDSTIDAVDWDSPSDPVLYSDLELQKQSQIIDFEEEDNCNTGPSLFHLSEALLWSSGAAELSCTGWGDDLEDDSGEKKDNEFPGDRYDEVGPCTGWGDDEENSGEKNGNEFLGVYYNNVGPGVAALPCTGWGDYENNSGEKNGFDYVNVGPPTAFSCNGWGDDSGEYKGNEFLRDRNDNVGQCSTGWGDYDLDKNFGEAHQKVLLEPASNIDRPAMRWERRRGRSGRVGTEARQRYPAEKSYESQQVVPRGNRGRKKHPLRQWNIKSCAQVS